MHTQQGKENSFMEGKEIYKLQETKSWFFIGWDLAGKKMLPSLPVGLCYHHRAPSSGFLTLTEVSVHSSVDCGIRSLISPPDQFADKSAILTHIGKFWSVFLCLHTLGWKKVKISIRCNRTDPVPFDRINTWSTWGNPQPSLWKQDLGGRSEVKHLEMQRL